MSDMSRELSAFFDQRYPKHARQISQAVKLPNGWVLAESFERRRDNRGGAYTIYYATRVKSKVLLGHETANTGNHREIARPEYPEVKQQVERWYKAFRDEEVG